MKMTTRMIIVAVTAFGILSATNAVHAASFMGPRTGDFSYSSCGSGANAAPVAKMAPGTPIDTTARAMCYCVRDQVGPEAYEKIACRVDTPT